MSKCLKLKPGREFQPAFATTLANRMRDRSIGLDDLNRLRGWLEVRPIVPEGLWFKDFGSFKLCGEGKYPKTFLLAGQVAMGQKL